MAEDDDAAPQDDDDLTFAPGTPEEYQEFMRKAHAEQKMQGSAIRHNLMAFIEGLNKDQLDTLLTLFSMFEGDETRIPFFAGILVAERFRRFNACLACGVDHEAEIAAMAEGGNGDAEASE